MSDTVPPEGHHAEDDQDLDRPIEANLKSSETWKRLLFMVIFCFLVGIANFVGAAIVVLGFLWVLFTGETNRQLVQTGQSLASYLYEIVRYLTFNTEEKPFPFGRDWPSSDIEESL